MQITCSHAIAAAMASASFATIANADILIDDFFSVGSQNPWPVSITESVGLSVTETNLASVLGGTRQTTIGPDKPLDWPGLQEVNVMINPCAGLLEYSSTATWGALVRLDYYGEGGGPSGQDGNLNLDLSGESGILISTAAIDSNDLDIEVTLFNATYSYSATAHISNSQADKIELLFEDFLEIEYADMQNITGISVSIQGSSGSDYLISGISTFSIPEPATLALLGASAIIGRRRKR